MWSALGWCEARGRCDVRLACWARRVDVEVLPPETAAVVSVARFRREIALAARLQRPHIVSLLSPGEMDGATLDVLL